MIEKAGLLENCPFCGSEAEESLTGTLVRCSDEFCDLGHLEYWRKREAWNTRHLPESVEKVLEAAREWTSLPHNVGGEDAYVKLHEAIRNHDWRK